VNLDIKTLDGQHHSVLRVSDDIFSKEYNEPLIHQVIVGYMSSSRQGSCAQKTRSEVSGSGAKPWKQKGTGRARAGTIRSPIFRKGGVTFAAKPRSYKKKINRKMYRSALQSIISELLRNKRLSTLHSMDLKTPKTKDLVSKLKNLGFVDALIAVTSEEFTEYLRLASRNIKNIAVCNTQEINPVALMSFNNVVMTQSAIKELEERLT